MAIISFNIPNNVLHRFVEAIAVRKGYTGFLEDGTTPQTKEQFFKAYFIKHAKEETAEHERQAAMNTASQNVVTEINSINIQ